jgi:hypothetical protein
LNYRQDMLSDGITMNSATIGLTVEASTLLEVGTATPVLSNMVESMCMYLLKLLAANVRETVQPVCGASSEMLYMGMKDMNTISQPNRVDNGISGKPGYHEETWLSERLKS